MSNSKRLMAPFLAVGVNRSRKLGLPHRAAEGDERPGILAPSLAVGVNRSRKRERPGILAPSLAVGALMLLQAPIAKVHTPFQFRSAVYRIPYQPNNARGVGAAIDATFAEFKESQAGICSREPDDIIRSACLGTLDFIPRHVQVVVITSNIWTGYCLASVRSAVVRTWPSEDLFALDMTILLHWHDHPTDWEKALYRAWPLLMRRMEAVKEIGACIE